MILSHIGIHSFLILRHKLREESIVTLLALALRRALLLNQLAKDHLLLLLVLMEIGSLSELAKSTVDEAAHVLGGLALTDGQLTWIDLDYI